MSEGHIHEHLSSRDDIPSERLAPITAGGFKVSGAASIGTHAHADVHVLVHTPGNPNELWCGCDGGVFLNRDPRGSGQFASQNTGLASLCSNFIAHHPTDPANRDHVLAATTHGLYQRVLTPGGGVEWVQRRPGVHSSVVVTSAGGTTRFFAAEWGTGVFHSTDGITWQVAGTGFPPERR